MGIGIVGRSGKRKDTGNIGIVWGGTGRANNNTIEYFTIAKESDAIDFGDLSVTNVDSSAAVSNGQNDRGVAFHQTSSSSSHYKYVTISTPSNSTEFGNTLSNYADRGAASNGTNERGLIIAGQSGVYFNNIEYITISTPSGATDFGDTLNRGEATGRRSVKGCSNGTSERALIWGGVSWKANPSSGTYNWIEYITMSTTGDGVDFGDMSGGVSQSGSGSCTSNDTDDRGVYMGGVRDGGPRVNMIEYVTITSTGDGSDFGDLTELTQSNGELSNGTDQRGCSVGRYTGAVATNEIEYITIDTTGDATDFGDLSEDTYALGTCDDAMA